MLVSHSGDVASAKLLLGHGADVNATEDANGQTALMWAVAAHRQEVVGVLLEAGALDVTLEYVLMKKNRPGTLIRVIAKPEDREQLANVIFAETTTLGLRIHSAERRVKARRILEVDTPHGKVKIKIAGDGSFSPEYEDCRTLARATGIPLKEILAEASLAYLKNTR